MSETTSRVEDTVLSELVDAWRSSTLGTGWRSSRDWSTPEVSEFAAALLAGVGVESAAEALGAARATVGVGLAEALRDFGTAYRVAELGTPDVPAMAAFSQGWADAIIGEEFARGAIDPRTGLGSRDYLELRLREQSARGHGTLIVIDTTAGSGGWHQLARLLSTRAVLNDLFGDAVPQAALDDARLAVVLDGSDDVDEALARLRVRLAAVVSHEVALRPVPIEEGFTLSRIL